MTKQYKSPDGKVIVGTLERISGMAYIAGINADGTPEYSGETDIWWNGQMPARDADGKLIFLDEDENEWTFDQLVPVENPGG